MKTIALNVDCMEYMKTLEDGAFDLGHCDPPYGINENAKATRSRGGYVKQKNGSKIYCEASDFGNDDWDNEPPPQEYFNELFRVCKNVILWGANYYEFNQKGTSTGRLVWDKCRRKSSGQGDAELAWTSLFSSVRVVSYLWDGFLQGEGVGIGRKPFGDKSMNEKRLQNGHKPIKLYQAIASRFYKPGWKIFDSHLGSGSHRIACEKKGFEFVGAEISKKRYDQSVNWYSQGNLFREQKPKGNFGKQLEIDQ